MAQQNIDFIFQPGTDIIKAYSVLLSCGHSVDPELTPKSKKNDEDVFVCPCCKKVTKINGTSPDLSTRQQTLEYLQKNPTDWEKVHFSLFLQKKIRDMIAKQPMDSKKLLDFLQQAGMDPRVFTKSLSDGKTSITLFDLLCKFCDPKTQCSSDLFALVWDKYRLQVNLDKYFDIANSLINNKKVEFATLVVKSHFDTRYNLTKLVSTLLERTDCKTLSILLKTAIDRSPEDGGQIIRSIFDYAIKYNKYELLLMLQENGIDLLREIPYEKNSVLRSQDKILNVFDVFLATKQYKTALALFHDLLRELESIPHDSGGADEKIMQLLNEILYKINVAITSRETVGTFINSPCKFENYKTITPLSYALLTQRESLACELIKLGAPVEQTDDNNRNGLFLACMNKMQKVISAIVKVADENSKQKPDYMLQLLQCESKFHGNVLNFILSSKDRATYEQLKKFITPRLLQQFKVTPKLLLCGVFAPGTVARVSGFNEAANYISSKNKEYDPATQAEYFTDGLLTAMRANNIPGIDCVLLKLNATKFHCNHHIVVDAILQNPVPLVKTLRYVYDKAISKKAGILNTLFYVCSTLTKELMTQCKKNPELVSKIFNRSCDYNGTFYSAFDLLVRVRPQTASTILSEIIANEINIGDVNIKPAFLHAISLGNITVSETCFKKLYPDGNIPDADVDNIVAVIKAKSTINPLQMLRSLIAHQTIASKISEQARSDIIDKLGNDAENIFAEVQNKAPAPKPT